MATDVFFSYAVEDKVAATTVCETLESEGVSCWIAPRDIQPGAQWARAIMDAISTSRVMVLVFSEDANRSDETKQRFSLLSQPCAVDLCVYPAIRGVFQIIGYPHQESSFGKRGWDQQNDGFPRQ